MSTERGTGGKNANYGWANVAEPPSDPVVDAWIAALFAKPCTWDEYRLQMRLSAERNAEKPRNTKERVHEQPDR
jgi:hypothetical protein